MRFRAYDHGSAAPFSVGWYAVVQADFQTPHGKILPKGALIKYREWYGAVSANKGLKQTAEATAVGIKDREQGEKIDYAVADPSIYQWDGGPSIAERMAKRKVIWHAADNNRIAGWDQVRRRLVGEEEDGSIPMLYLFDINTNTLRTLPTLTHDKRRIEDVDTKQEDHAADELRYACMSRPYVRGEEEEEKDPWRMPTLDEWANKTVQSRKREEANNWWI